MKSLRPFRLVFAASNRVRERFSSAGLAVATLTLFAGAFGLDTVSNYSHGVFSFGLMLLVVDFVASRRLRPDIEVARELPDFLSVGQPGRYTLTVRNRGRRRLVGLTLHERLRQPFPSAAEFSRRLPSGLAAGNRFDRVVGYPDWIDWLRRLRCVDIEPLPIPPLDPGQRVGIVVALRPVHRGLAVFEGVRLARPGPLGLCLASCELDAASILPGGQTLPVLPARLALDLPAVASHRQLQPGGVSLALRVGDSEEFRSLRDYRPGDPLRAIHWRSWARTGRPVVREYQDEFFSRHALVLDTAASALFDPAFETAVALAASCVVRRREADSLLDMLFVGDRVHRLTSGRGLGQTAGLLRVLATVTPTPAAGFRPLADTVAQGAAQIGSLVCILLSWDDERRQFVRRMQALGVTPVVFVVAAAAPGADEADSFPLRRIEPGALAASGTAA